MTGCAGPDSLQCLKTIDVQTLRTAALAISSSHTYNTSSYTWAPVIDMKFLTQTLTSATAVGAMNMDFGLGMYNLHEGENFIPPGLQNTTDTGSPPFNSSQASFEVWLKGFLPDLSQRNLDRLQHLYPPEGIAEELVYNTTYVRAGLIYRDVTLACPALWMAKSAHLKSYVGEYTIDPADHGADTVWWNRINPIQSADPYIYEGFTGAFASFFETGDPNAHEVANLSLPGVPEYKEGGEEYVIGPDGFNNIRLPRLERRCGFWMTVAHEISI